MRWMRQIVVVRLGLQLKHSKMFFIFIFIEVVIGLGFSLIGLGRSQKILCKLINSIKLYNIIKYELMGRALMGGPDWAFVGSKELGLWTELGFKQVGPAHGP